MPIDNLKIKKKEIKQLLTYYTTFIGVFYWSTLSTIYGVVFPVFLFFSFPV